VAVLALPEGDVVIARGECQGRILAEARGRGGFGYDPIFQMAEQDCSMAELPAAEKNRLSHRARALRELAPAIRQHLVPVMPRAVTEPSSAGDPGGRTRP
jgi:XTP/dITP diphosphohydrolase